MNNGLFTSKKYTWNTPPDVVADLKTVFPFDLDVCANAPNVCVNYYSEGGLEKEWHGLCWMNPPYGREIGKWMTKAANSQTTVICLVPARTDTRWWHTAVTTASLVVFVKNRFYFVDALGKGGAAPFPSAFITYGDLTAAQVEKLASYGWAIPQT